MRVCFFCDISKEETEMIPEEFEYQTCDLPICVKCVNGFISENVPGMAVKKMYDAVDLKMGRIKGQKTIIKKHLRWWRFKKWFGVALIAGAFLIPGCTHSEGVWIRWHYNPGYVFTDSSTNKKHYQKPIWGWMAAYPNYQACVQGIKNEIKAEKAYLSKEGKGEIFDFDFNDDTLEVYSSKDHDKLQLKSQCFSESSSPIKLDKEEGLD